MIRALLLAFLLFAPAVQAQAQECRLPERLESRPCGSKGPVVGQANDFDYYVLALSWSPQFCADAGRARANPLQCEANRFGLVVHGLWPQYRDRPGQNANKRADWPQYCQPSQALPEALLRRHLCRQPSAVLMNCQWAKHGSCSGMSAAAYFAATERLAGTLVLPDLPRGEQRAGDLAASFAKANAAAGLRQEHMAVIARDGALSEIRLCYTKNMTEFVTCDRAVGAARPGARLQVR